MRAESATGLANTADRTTQSSPALREAPADAILGRAQSSREIIQDFVPLAESLEWELGQEYLRGRGNKAFISDAAPVPFVVNNDGSLSRKGETKRGLWPQPKQSLGKGPPSQLCRRRRHFGRNHLS